VRRRGLVLASGALFGVLGVTAAWLRVHLTQYDDMIMLAAARNGVDFYLVKALIFEESWFRAASRGPAGEVGLMQITKAAAADFCARRGFAPFDGARLLEPELNVEVGCWYLRQSLDRYKDSPNPTLFALLRYNAGAQRADAWRAKCLSKPVPPGVSADRYYLSMVDIPGTREYAHRILRRQRSRHFWF
jgi:soluble lytic murein transglycosylase